MQQIQNSVVFEGPIGSKNLALDAQGEQTDFIWNVSCKMTKADSLLGVSLLLLWTVETRDSRK